MIVIINEKGTKKSEPDKQEFRWTPLRVAFSLVLVLALVPLVSQQYGLRFSKQVLRGESTSKVQSKDQSSLSERERLCIAALENIKQFDDDPLIKGTRFLREKGVVLALPSSTVPVTVREDVRLPIYNCGSCKDPYECRVHIHARLVGETAIRSALVHQAEDGDFYVDFKAPPVTGTYALHASTRWWHGDEFPTTYLGGPAKMKVRETDNYLRREASCTVYGSPQSVKVNPPSEVQPTRAKVRTCHGIEEPGYWEWVDKDELCQQRVGDRGECFVLDSPNATWHYRGDDCRVKFPNLGEIKRCLKDTTIVVYGDSLSREFRSNLWNFLPEHSHGHVIGDAMEPQFGNFSKGVFETETKRVVFVTDFNAAHIIQHPMKTVYNKVAPKVESEWKKVLKNKPANVTVEGIFYTGYLPYCQRENGVSFTRMQEVNSILAESARKVELKIFNTTAPTLSRPDASWDGLHFLIGKNFGGVSKFLTMMLIQDICGSS